ncbi:MAG: hypothetical protein ACYSWP_18715, partial [Planctomycetota bacterium]
MTITGGIKFFERSSALFNDGTTAVASSNSSAANNILTNRLDLVYYESIGSDDLTTVTITVTYNTTVTIDRIILNKINFKEFTVKYDSGGMWTDFTSVVGIDGALSGGISETAFADESAYYEVASITTSELQISITKTQTVDAEKIIYNLFTTEELGTFEGYPQIVNIDFNRNSRESQVLSGLAQIQKSYEVNSFGLELESHPSQADMDLISTLFDESKSFLVWLCGGRRGSDYFRFDIKGFRLPDIYNMQTSGSINPNYPLTTYINAPNNTLT